MNSFTIGIQTSNRLECINQKINNVCSAFSDLGSFFKDFQTVVASLRDHIAITCVSTISVKAIGSSVYAQYSRLFNPYAAKLVREQLEDVEKVQVIDGRVKVTENSSVKCSLLFSSDYEVALP